MRIAVIGSNGQLGSDIARAFQSNGDEVHHLTHQDIAVEDLDSVSKALREGQADLVVNTAAMHHVENCEREPERAFVINGLGARNVATVSDAMGAVVAHISTDYVFDGKKGKPYEETDAPLPLSVYGNTKLSGEYFVRSTAKKHFVLRVSAIYGESPCRAKGGLNFVELMLKLAREKGKVRVVDSEFVTPTPTKQIAQQIVALSRSDNYGLYHATAEGSCSWYEFAKEIFTRTDTKVDLQVAGANEFPMKVARPTYSVLENRKLKHAGLNVFKPWQMGLQDYLEGKLQPSVSGK